MMCKRIIKSSLIIKLKNPQSRNLAGIPIHEGSATFEIEDSTAKTNKLSALRAWGRLR